MFGAVYNAPHLGEIIAYSAGGALVDLAGPRITLVIAGTGVLLALSLIRLLLSPPLRPTARG